MTISDSKTNPVLFDQALSLLPGTTSKSLNQKMLMMRHLAGKHESRTNASRLLWDWPT